MDFKIGRVCSICAQAIREGNLLFIFLFDKKKILVYFKTLILCMKHNNIITRIIFELVLQKNTQIVEFRIPGYPGPSKERCTEVRLMRGKIFRGKI